MALNFQICFHTRKDDLKIELGGDFDGSSAFELLNLLKERGPKYHRIQIDTSDLKTVYPFGRDVFEKKLKSCGKRFNNIVFTGKHINRFAPDLAQR